MVCLTLEGSVTCFNLEHVPISYPESSGFLVQSGYEVEHVQYELNWKFTTQLLSEYISVLAQTGESVAGLTFSH